MRLAFPFVLLSTSLAAQAPDPPPAFEAASVKLNTGDAFYQNMGIGQVEMRNFPLNILISMAYGGRLSGPDWLDSVKLDVVAKLPVSAGALSPQERARLTSLMLQRLLSDRLKLSVHQEEKIVPGYALVVAPGGLKMRRVDGPLPGGVVDYAHGSIKAKGSPISQIVASASGVLRMPVKDMTGLAGYYEFNLTWTPESTLLSASQDPTTASDDRPPSMITALPEQLGLKLEPQKLPIQITVVDYVERTPSEN